LCPKDWDKICFFDLGVFDEAHKTANRPNTRFSFALENKNLPIRKRLFMTATPRHYDVMKKDKEGDFKRVYSMDDSEVYGRISHTLSFAEAVERGIITKNKILVSVVTSGMLTRELIRRGEVIINRDIIKSSQVAGGIAIQMAIEKYPIDRIFTFHNTVKAAKSFTSDSSEGVCSFLNSFTAFHVNGSMPTGQRDGRLKEFENSNRSIMSNAKCLTEGVDVPSVDMVAFMSPKKSRVEE